MAKIEFAKLYLVAFGTVYTLKNAQEDRLDAGMIRQPVNSVMLSIVSDCFVSVYLNSVFTQVPKPKNNGGKGEQCTLKGNACLS